MKPSANPAYLPHIDGLRGLSVLVILLYHLDLAVFGGGFVGVDVFFVISGYLITGIITRELSEDRFSLANFYARRIRRIFPALFVMLFITSLAAIVSLAPNEYAVFFKSMRMAALEISNIFFSRESDYFAPSSKNTPLLHTWSLGVEEQFYIIWPLLLLAMTKIFGGSFWASRRSIIFLVTILISSLAVSEYLTHTNQMAAFYLIQSRAWELALGGLLALRAVPVLHHPTQHRIIPHRIINESLPVLGLGMILVSAIFLKDTDFPGIKALLPCLGAALVISRTPSSTWASKIMGARLLVWVGLISYSLYLWHWPLIAFYKNYFNTALSPDTQIILACLSIALAWASYKFIEQPTRSSTLSTRAIIIAGLSVMIVFVVGSNLMKSSYNAIWRTGNAIDEVVIQPNALFNICAVEGGAFNTDQCIIGPNKDKYEVILSGDSHAAHYIPTVLGWAKSQNLTVRIFLRGACSTWVERKIVPVRQGKPDTYCSDLNKAFFKTLDEDNNIRIIFLGMSFGKADDDVAHSLKKIKTYGKKVYFLGDVPLFPADPNECAYKNNVLISRIIAPAQKDCQNFDWAYSDDFMKRSHDTLLPLLRKLDIPYFDAAPFIKTPYDKNGHFMYMDGHHLNQYGGEYLTPYLSDFMQKQ